MKWIALGCGPGAIAAMQHAPPHDRLIVANRAIQWCEDGTVKATPGFAYLSDTEAARLYGRAARLLRDRHGTRLVTLHRDKRALVDRGIADFDEFVEITNIGVPEHVRRGVFSDVSISGLIIAQYAILKGNATELHLIGHEGYRSRPNIPERDYADGGPIGANKDGALITSQSIGPTFRAIVRTYPEVRFVFHGSLSYDVSGPNVSRA